MVKKYHPELPPKVQTRLLADPNTPILSKSRPPTPSSAPAHPTSPKQVAPSPHARNTRRNTLPPPNLPVHPPPCHQVLDLDLPHLSLSPLQHPNLHPVHNPRIRANPPSSNSTSNPPNSPRSLPQPSKQTTNALAPWPAAEATARRAQEAI